MSHIGTIRIDLLHQKFHYILEIVISCSIRYESVVWAVGKLVCVGGI